MEDYYKILGIEIKDYIAALPEAGELLTMEEVNKAYKNAMRSMHPDKVQQRGGTEEEIQNAKNRSQEIKCAYDKIVELNNSDRKIFYDEALRQKIQNEIKNERRIDVQSSELSSVRSKELSKIIIYKDNFSREEVIARDDFNWLSEPREPSFSTNSASQSNSHSSETAASQQEVINNADKPTGRAASEKRYEAAKRRIDEAKAREAASATSTAKASISSTSIPRNNAKGNSRGS